MALPLVCVCSFHSIAFSCFSQSFRFFFAQGTNRKNEKEKKERIYPIFFPFSLFFVVSTYLKPPKKE